MEVATSLTDILQTAGGWGLSSILMVVIWRLWSRLQTLQERVFELLNKQNDILQALDRLDRRRE